jgi:peptidoglycan/xylan/chitin deacetylase (PgdA/CDA1 family)
MGGQDHYRPDQPAKDMNKKLARQSEIKMAVYVIVIIMICSLSPAWARIIYRGTQAKQVALTFDDGPAPGVTDKILDILGRKGVRATFFVIGAKAAGHPLLLERMAREGHEIGNHTYYHSRTNWINNEKLLKEIEATSKLISGATGRNVRYFRPPHGKLPYSKRKIIENAGYLIVLWSVSADDCYRPGRGIRKPASIVRLVVSRVRGADVVLMHDDSRQIVEALPGIIDLLKKRGYKFVTISGLKKGL